MASLGYRVPANLEEIRPEDFQLILRQIEGKPEEKLVSYLLLRTMKLARYHEENLGHFGLATDMYAHFTSPIRRYPDLVVHRALRALRAGRGRASARRGCASGCPRWACTSPRWSGGRPTPSASSSSGRRSASWRAGWARRFSGYVTGVQAFGLFVELDEVYVQGLVHVSSMTDDYYRFDEKAHLLKGENTGQGLPAGRPRRRCRWRASTSSGGRSTSRSSTCSRRGAGARKPVRRSAARASRRAAPRRRAGRGRARSRARRLAGVADRRDPPRGLCAAAGDC